MTNDEIDMFVIGCLNYGRASANAIKNVTRIPIDDVKRSLQRLKRKGKAHCEGFIWYPE